MSTSDAEKPGGEVSVPAAEPVVVDPTTGEPLGTVTAWMTETFSWFFSGPLPAPSALAEYDGVLPGLARRIVERWEGEATHRQSMERSIVHARIRNQSRGQIIGAVLAAIVLFAGIAFIATGKSTAGLVAILAPLTILVTAFVYGEVKGRTLRNGNQ